jgi:hypothetical protein
VPALITRYLLIDATAIASVPCSVASANNLTQGMTVLTASATIASDRASLAITQ